jgi:uncharacterized protein
MRRHGKAARYLMATFGITWTAWWTLARFGGLDDGPAPLLLVGGAGPLVAALAVRDSDERRELIRSTTAVSRLGRAWMPVLLIGAGPAVAAAVAATATGSSSVGSIGSAAGAVAFGLLAGLGEEPGWRGTLLRPWIDEHGIVNASVRTGLVWAVWHLPLYFASGTYQHGRGLGWFALSLVELPALSVLLSWAFRRSGWLVVAPLLAHALGNAAGEILPGEGIAADLAQTAAIITAGAWLARRLRQPGRFGESDASAA